MNCVWVITAGIKYDDWYIQPIEAKKFDFMSGAGQNVYLTYNAFEVEYLLTSSCTGTACHSCSCDYVKIFDGPSQTSSIIRQNRSID